MSSPPKEVASIHKLTKQRPFCPKGIIPVTVFFFAHRRSGHEDDLPPPYDGGMEITSRLTGYHFSFTVNRYPFSGPDDG